MSFRIALAGLLALAFSGLAFGGEMEQREQLRNQAGKLYMAESFAELDHLFDEARTHAARTDSGVWQLWVLHRGVLDAEDRPRSNAEADVQAQRARRWMAQRPDSVTAPLVLAEVELRHAQAVGCGECTVLDERQRPMLYEAALLQARTLFEQVKGKSSADPQWYADMVELARLQRWPSAKVEALVQEAETRAPYYYTIWFNAVDFALLSPDHAAQVDLVARRAVKATHGKEGNSLYARVWWYASQVRYGPRLFKQAAVSWKDFDAGVRDVMARYPDDWNRNNFANFACNAKHPERARELMRGFEPLPDAWDSFETFVECVQPQAQAPTLQT